MKKNSLFKILLIVMLVITLLTWLIPAGYYQGEYIESGINRLGFVDFCQYLILPFFQSMFFEVLIFLSAVGAFYGVLSKTGAYRKILEKIAKSLKKKGNVFLVITACAFALLSSFGGYGLLLLAFVPLFVSIILLMEYDKITALLVTVGAMLVGIIGTTYGVDYIGETLSALDLSYSAQLLYKIILLVLSLVVLVVFTLKYAKKNKVKNSNYEDKFLGIDSSKKSALSLYIVFGLLLVLLIVGCTNWSSAFEIKAFNDFHSWLLSISIRDYPIFSYLLGNSASALGTWKYFQMSIVLIIITFVVAKIYKVKALDEMSNGAKKILPTALLIVFSYAILIIVVNTGIFTTLMSYLLNSVNKFNILGLLVTTLINIVGSVLHVELVYVANFFLPYLAGNFSEAIVPAMLNVSTQALYGLTMFVAPTSLFLIFGLTYLEVPYVEWIKKTWKLVLLLFTVILVVLIIMFFVL